MYDIDREIDPSLCEMRNNELVQYISGSSKIQSIKKKSHHYEKDNHIVELVENICRELFYYSSSLQKINAKYEESMVQSVLLDNLKRITVHNCDKYGLIPEQKLFFLVVSYLHSKVNNNVNNLREYLNEVHYVLTSSVWKQPNQQIPFSLVMLLNGQFEELLNYTREELIFKSQPQLIQHLIDLLVYKIEDKQTTQSSLKQNVSSNNNTMIQSLIDSINNSEWMKNLTVEMKKKNQNVFGLFGYKQEIQILLGVITGNQSVIEQVCKGSWGLYLNLYINFMKNKSYEKNTNTNNNNNEKQLSYETIIRSYTQKYFSNGNNKNKNTQTQQINQLFLIKIINSSIAQSRFSFHQIYQQSFNTFSPILSHILGLLLLQCKVVDMYSMINNKEYYQQILLNLVDSCNGVSWSAFVHIIGFVQNSGHFKQSYTNQNIWESFMYQHLPYQIQTHNQQNPLHNQIKQIEEKLQDLNIVGLSSITKTYLTTLFNLQLNPSNSHNQLNEPILQLFFLTLEMTDSSTANACFHQMKTFLTKYYRNSYFNYHILDSLQNIFERKRTILSQKMEKKIQKLFCLPYKIKAIKDKSFIPTESQQQQQSILLQQIKEFNKLFLTSKNKKSISLSIQLLKLASQLHRSIQNTIGFNTQVEMDLQTNNQEQSDQQSLNLVKQFQRNLSNYLHQWKIYDIEHLQAERLSQQAFQQLSYFDQHFY